MVLPAKSQLCLWLLTLRPFLIQRPPAKGGKWKQVLIRGFPTYRAQSQLLSDPATGKTYFFGGYVNTDWVPFGKARSSRTFGDLWQLRLYFPGCDFADVDVDSEYEACIVRG
jgi:hypothetical protein